MEVMQVAVGDMQANAYVVYDPSRDDALVIDPGAESEMILMALGNRALSGILLTHGHIDHIGAVAALRSEDAPVFIHEQDAQMLTNPNLSLAAMVGGPQTQGEPDFCMEEGEMTVAGITLNVIHTPGHTGGSCCFQVGDLLFTGDTLFRMGIGRTDFPGGDADLLAASLAKLLSMDGGITVYPGHGQETTIADERRHFG